VISLHLLEVVRVGSLASVVGLLLDVPFSCLLGHVRPLSLNALLLLLVHLFDLLLLVSLGLPLGLMLLLLLLNLFELPLNGVELLFMGRGLLEVLFVDFLVNLVVNVFSEHVVCLDCINLILL